jgi:hypothetical protein
MWTVGFYFDLGYQPTIIDNDSYPIYNNLHKELNLKDVEEKGKE